uniref:Endo-1,4-beta-xylanase n=1 Tax=uncultured bacterium contig00007 TaxID=1181499 RepID=A0A806KSA9_9BACT|nr:endo-1,4-beta-xylanase precursor [uncultured bacterium contig00007]
MKKRLLIAAAALIALTAFALTSCKEPNNKLSKPETYTVTFDKNHNDASGWTDADPVTKKVTEPATNIDSLPAEPTREGYLFTGWNTDADGEGLAFTKETSVYYDMTVYAQWFQGNTLPELDGTASINQSTAANYRIGQTLTLNTSAISAPATGHFTYHWKANNVSIVNATHETYTIQGSDAGKTISCDISHSVATGTITASGEVVPYEIRIHTDEATKQGDDAVSIAPPFGRNGETITITYTLDNVKLYNTLTFSGLTSAHIDAVTTAAVNGTKTYTVAGQQDATHEGIITINAAFTHSDKPIVELEFTQQSVEKTYGDGKFTNAVKTVVSQGGFIYTSKDDTIATVDGNSGEVTILKAGTVTIYANKDEDDNEYTEAEYTLTIDPKPITITVAINDKVYDGTTSATFNGSPSFTAGAIINDDDVSITGGTAEFPDANAGTGKTVNISDFELDGDDKDNYELTGYTPNPVTASISAASGAAVSGTPTAHEVTQDSITIYAVTISGPNTLGQVVEYARATAASPVPASGWQEDLTFTGLNHDTDYYIFARSKAKTETVNFVTITNVNAGTAQSAVIKTGAPPPPPQNKVDFERYEIGQTFPITGTTAITATIVDDNGKALEINSNDYDRAAVIPIDLSHSISAYESITLKFKKESGSGTSGTIQVLAYSSAPSSVSMYNNTTTQIAISSNLTFSSYSSWGSVTLPISPAGSTGTLGGNTIYLAIGIRVNNVVYRIDDIIFNIKPPSVTPAATQTFNINAEATANNEDIVFTVALNGDTLVRIDETISGTTTTLASPQYSESGTTTKTITLSKDNYLSAKNDGDTITITFVFGEGTPITRTINIIDEAGGTPPELITSYDFSIDPTSSNYRSNGTMISGLTWAPDEITGTSGVGSVPTASGVIKYSIASGNTGTVYFKFDLGDGSLDDYESVTIVVKNGGSGNNLQGQIFASNDWTAEGSAVTADFGYTFAQEPGKWYTRTLPLNAGSSALQGYTGEIALGLRHPHYVTTSVEIKSITLNPKP